MTHQGCLAHIATLEKQIGKVKAEAQYYLEELQAIWTIASPSERGHYKRDLGTLVLNRVAYAVSFRQRNYIAVLANNSTQTKG